MPSKRNVTFSELHYTRSFRNCFISAFSDAVRSVVLCSPFFDALPAPFGNIVGFSRFLQVRGVKHIQIITRPPGHDKTAMSMEVAKELAGLGVEILIRSSPYHHAKMYHIEYEAGYYRCFVGSANFTLGGFDRNYEIVAEMQGVGDTSPIHRELQRMQEIGTLSYHAWIAKGQPKGQEERL